MSAVPTPLVYSSRRKKLTQESMFWGSLDRLIRNPQGFVGLTGLLVLVLAAVFADVIAWHDPLDQSASGRFLPPSLDHPFGTEELRRDLFARTLFGLRASLAVSMISVIVGATVGVCIGFIAGYAGRWVDATLMRVVDALLAFPGLLAALAIVTILGPGLRNVGIAIALFSVPSFARLARAQMLAERGKDYVRAAEALGVGPLRIIFRHIAANAVPPLITQVALAMASAVILSASLSFLGLGERAPQPSLGGLINSAKPHLKVAWWYAAFPGAVLAILLLSLNLLADAINDATNPFSRSR